MLIYPSGATHGRFWVATEVNRRPLERRTVAVILTLLIVLTIPIAAIKAKSSQTAIVQTRKTPSTVAMVVVVDVSGSMSGGQLTICKEAAKASLKTLRNSDRFGTLSFNTGFTWVAPLQPIGNRDAINAQIETMISGGGTNIYVGLDAAYEALKNASEEVKLALVLSDGITQTADFQALTAKMINAGINVSTISLGVRSNRELLSDIAKWGKGRAYYLDSYERVPQVVVRETELVLGNTP